METRYLRVFTAAQIVCVLILLGVILSRPGVWDLQRDLGTALVLVGLGGIGVARRQLGKSFAIQAEAHKLVTHGIYSKIRNPIYTFGMVLVAGFALTLHRPIYWLVFLAVAVMQILRARREARVLEAAFGDAYRDYRRKTWF